MSRWSQAETRTRSRARTRSHLDADDISASSGAEGGGGWSRRRLRATAAAVVLVLVVLVAAGVWALCRAVFWSDDVSGGEVEAAGWDDLDEHTESGTSQGQAHRDEIAAAPMREVPAVAALPRPEDQPGTGDASIEVPTGVVGGPALVLTGFPQTPQGAVGQLAQIDIAALQAMSTPTAQEIYQAWALPGGVGEDQWWITRSVEAFLDSAGMGEVIDPSASIRIEPAAGLVKGTDGPDWTTACVLLRVEASYRQDAKFGFGHCERMQWTGGRWMIAPGDAPAPAPSVWPGTRLAEDAGWRTWTDHAHDQVNFHDQVNAEVEGRVQDQGHALDDALDHSVDQSTDRADPEPGVATALQRGSR